MASVTIDGSVPADSENESLGASRIRNLAAAINGMFGEGVTFTYGANPFIVDGSGNVTIPVSLTVPTPTAAGQAANKAYVDASGNFFGTTTGTDTYAVTLTPAPASLAALTDILIAVAFINPNTGAAASLNPNGLGSAPILKWSGGVLVNLSLGDLPAGYTGLLLYDGTEFQLLNPATASGSSLDAQSGNPLVDIVSSTAETSIYSFAIPADTIGINQKVRLTILGDVLANSGSNQGFEMRVKFGGTTVLDTLTSFNTLTHGANRQNVKGVFEIQNLGVTNAQFVNGAINQPTGVANGNGSIASQWTGQYAGLAIDTTANQTLQVTVQLSASSASVEFRMFGAILELL